MSETPIESWHPSGDGFRWRARQLSATVDGFAENQTRLTLLTGRSDHLQITLGSVEYQSADGRNLSCVPRCIDPYIQPPTLFVPQLVDSAVGLRLELAFHGQSDAITMDLRMQTIAPIENLRVQASLSWTDGTVGEALIREEKQRTAEAAVGYAGRWQLAGQQVAMLFTELGQAGTMVRDQADDRRIEVMFFNEPLEKGVILVGRLALVANGVAGEPAVLERFETWRQWGSYL